MLFFNKKDNKIYSPVSGFCTDISKCKDATFASKVMGDGFLIVPNSKMVCSPCDGIITMLFPTLHAFGIKNDDGVEILIHIGIDTVNLNGKYFKKLSDKGKKVKHGTPIIEFDLEHIIKEGYDPNVMMIFVGNNSIQKNIIDCDVSTESVLVK